MPSIGTLIHELTTRLAERFPGNQAAVPFALVYEFDDDLRAYTWAGYIEVRDGETEFDIRSISHDPHRAMTTLTNRLQSELAGA